VVDQWTGWNSASLTIDGVHPNDAGHQRMAGVWYPALLSALNGAGTPSNGFPYCANGSGSDPDGDGWGWENNASCVVRGSAADPARTAPNGFPYCANGSGSDPDGDGWGWENNASCVVRGSAADRTSR
jgi:mannan endo-1,4-beta-mannosidase